MSVYQARCRRCRWISPMRHTETEALDALDVHVDRAHQNENGGAATGRPHHTTTPTDERRQQ